MSVLDKPFLWGPVGGGTEPPTKLLSVVGLTGMPEALARIVLRRLAARRPAVRQTQAKADVVFAQTQATADKLPSARNIEMVTNATSVDLNEIALPTERSSDIVFASRLVSWKAGQLAIRTMRHLLHPTAVLRVFGDGPDRARMERAAHRWGVAHRVRFEGRIPRDELLQTLAGAGAVLHPSLHDEAALSVAEALTFGTPVVCLSHAGPAALCEAFPDSPSTTVPATWPDPTARSLAHAADLHLASPPAIPGALKVPVHRLNTRMLQAYEQLGRRAASG